METLINKWKKLVNKANSHGIPFPMIRDPKTGLGSITATLVIMSSGLASISIIMMLAVFIAKITDLFVLNENTFNAVKEAFSSSMQFFIASLAGYLGRRLQSDKKTATLDSEANNK